MKLRTLLLSSALISLPLGAQAEENVTPRGTYVPYEPPAGFQLPDQGDALDAPDGAAEAFNSNIIYLNACWGDCQITRGYPDDARINRSSIPRSSSSTLSEFAFGESNWNAVVACVREMYEPFNVEIVTEDPGNVTHFEAMVAGSPGEVGMSNGVGGVSPFSCGVIDNAITYSFANIYGGSVQQLCEVVAQETAHAFGLDHEFHCPDPMTYLSGCGPKSFRDLDAQCGEFEARACQCGGSTQNSVQEIMAIFGPATPTPPTVTITEPTQGETVEPGFVIRVDATDNVQVVSAELRIDGQTVLELTQGPWVFNAPQTLGQGNHTVEVIAKDNRGDQGSDSIGVVLGAPCGGSGDCEGGEACVDGRCVPGADTPGGLGNTCEGAGDCLSGLCANDGTDRYCVEPCTEACPGGFSCVDTGGQGVCWPAEGGGCSASTDTSRGTAMSFLLAMMLGAFVFRRRRIG